MTQQSIDVAVMPFMYWKVQDKMNKAMRVKRTDQLVQDYIVLEMQRDR